DRGWAPLRDEVRASSLPWRPCGSVGWSGWLRSHTGRSDLIGGMNSKLCGIGGESGAHSRVIPSQGVGPTFLPLRSGSQTLIRNGMSEAASMKAPIDDSMFRKLHPALDG